MALYAPASVYDFVQYDDDLYVFDNTEVQKGLSLNGLVWTIVDAHAGNYHPLTWVSHMLDCQLFGLRAGGHHFVNTLFHSLNAGLLFLFLRSITGAFWRSAFVAALFAWHPMRTESVAWISERKDLLSGFFFILTLWAYALYSRASGEMTRKRLFYRLSLILFALGLLAKPMLVMAPFVLLLLDWWPLKRTGTSPRHLLKEKIPFFLMALSMGIITCFVQKGAMNVAGPLSLMQRSEGALVAYAWYLEKLFWPQSLSILNLRPPIIPLSNVAVAVGILVLLSGVMIAYRRAHPYLLIGWLWFLGMLLPVIGLIPVGLQLTADRYTYLPSIGLFIGITWTVYTMALGLGWIARPRVLGSLAGAALLASAVASEHQLGYWRNTETLMEHALSIDPRNYVAHIDLGLYFAKRGNTEAARFHHNRARELLPKPSPISR